MESRSGSGATGPSDAAISEALERLYAAPLEGFVSLRREIAASLRASGHAPASRLIAAVAKPSRTAWAMNQVARRRPELVQSAFDAWATAVADQAKPSEGDGATLRSSARAFRDALAKVVQAASELAREGGAPLTAEQGRRLGATLHAAASERDSRGRDALVAGRLATDIDLDDPFGGLEIGPAGTDRLRSPSRPSPPEPPRDELAPRRAAAAEAAARAAERKRADEQRAAERERELRTQAIEKARSRVSLLETEAKEARASARQAEVVASRAKTDAERARREVEALEQRLDEAIKDLQKLRT